MTLLIVTAVASEAEAIGARPGVDVIVAGIGRTNAAAATTEAIVRRGPYTAVLSAGVAGALPRSGLELRRVIVASSCVYAEEGLLGPEGFAGMEGLGFSLGDFPGNAVPVDPGVLAQLAASGAAVGPIATVATCSGTDAQARTVEERTGALAEAMEGAAVVHAARRLGVPGGELRVISNTTGDRPRQRWDLGGALAALACAVARAVDAMEG